jgi:pimeloyl-ACP methyl ester carboxylesterase
VTPRPLATGLSHPGLWLALWLGLWLLGFSSVPAALAQEPDLRCGQEPGSRFFWTEWGFCDLEPHGPEKARGLVIWNHGISGTAEQYKAPPALALRLLHPRGWDILKLNRNNLGETRDLSLARATERNEAEIRAQLARGYRRVALAGQSFGGYISLETAAGSRDVFGVVAMAPGVTTRGSVDRLDPSITERLIADVKARRLALVFPQGDALFDNRIRGPGALRALAARPAPYLVIDETATTLSGHGGGTGGRFALRYGLCLADFLSAADSPPPGRVVCSGGREGAAARDLLMKPWPAAARPPRDGDALAGFAPPPGGFWYGLVGETVVVVVVLRGEGDALRVLYRALSPRLSGGVHPARVEGEELRATLGEGSVPSIALRRASANALELYWTAADGGRTLRTTLHPAGDLD